MTLFFADLVREFSSSAGTGDFVLDGAVPGHRRFAGVVPVGARFHYAIAGVTRPEEWETGGGEIGSGGSLLRAPAASSAGGALVDFGTGLKTVALTVGALWFAEQDGAFQPLNADLSAIAAGGTTAFGRAQLGLADAAALRGHAGLGSAAVRDVGTSGAAVPVLAGGATAWAAGATFAGTLTSVNSSASVIAAGGSPSTAGLAGPCVRLLYIAGAPGLALVQGFDHSSGAEERLGLYGSEVVVRAADVVVGRFHSGGLDVPAGALAVSGVRVVSERRGGWSAASGTASRSGFDTGSVTTAALAERVKALIDDLLAHGLIGA